MIPENKIEELRERIDLVGLVQRHGVSLKKSGKTYRGLCPFHGEKSPSFYVYPDSRRFKCFGCQAGGDSIGFVQRLLGKPFLDTVRDLAKEAGVDLESAVDPIARERAQLKEATDFAQRFFEAQLHGPPGAGARSYLASRGLEVELIRQFGLGYSPPEWTALADRLRENGLLGFAERAGLTRARPQGDGYYDFFRGRLTIPIRSPEGRPIGFGARALEPGQEPKYLNSPESPLYRKGQVLFAVDRARDAIRKARCAVLVEGYFDAIGLHQAGVTHAVALCSTALTPEHLELLRRLEARELILLLDGDAAGRAAVERLAGPLLALGLPTRVALLPDGEDPDTFARKVGAAGVQALLAAARPLSEHLLVTALPGGKDASFEAKMAALERLKPIVAQLAPGLHRSTFLTGLSRHLAVPSPELESALRGEVPRTRPVPKPSGQAGASQGASPARAATMEPPHELEALYAAAVLKDRLLLAQDTERVDLELKHPYLRQLVAGLRADENPADLLEEAPEAVRKALVAAREQLPSELEAAFGQVCLRLRLKAVEDRSKRLSAELALLPGSDLLDEAARALLDEKRELNALKVRLEGELRRSLGRRPPPPAS